MNSTRRKYLKENYPEAFDSAHILKLTKREQKFIKRLENLLDVCPKTLSLFGWSGSLHVVKLAEDGHPCTVADAFSVNCDGGDPNDEELSQDVFIEYR